MKKNIIPVFALLAFLASACNDDYNDQFNLKNEITDVKDATLTLEASDYSAIASNESNQELALSKDPEGKVGVDALNAVGKKGYFTVDAPAEEYIPAFLLNKFPYADLGSKYKVTYKQYQAPSAYLSDFSNVSAYELTEDDYKTVWGDKVSASFLSPATVGEIGTILKANLPDAAEGDVTVVNYAYSQTEPSIGGGGTDVPEVEPTWTEVTLPVRATGANWDFVNTGAIDLSAYKGQTINVAFRYKSADTGAATWELKNAQALSVPYIDFQMFAKQEDGSFAKLAKLGMFEGAGQYVMAAMGVDGQYYPFGKLPEGKEYGYMYPAAITVTDGKIAATDAADYVLTFAASATVEGAYTILNAQNQYLWMDGNFNSFQATTEMGAAGNDWTVSSNGADLFVLTNVAKEKSVKLNYYKGSYSIGSYPADVIKNNTYYTNTLMGDDGGFTIDDIDIAGLDLVWQNTEKYGFKASAFVSNVNYATESWLISPAITIAEDATLPYFTIDEAFRFGNGAADLTVLISTDYTAAAASIRALTRAAVKPTTTALYRYDGSKWSLYNSDDVNVTAFSTADYDNLGADVISEPEAVLPIYAASNYPYAQEGDKIAVVYAYKAGEYDIDELVKTAEGWILTPDYIEQTTTFTLEVNENGARTYTAKISVWIDDSLLGSTGGFEIQDISLNGVTYVWTNTSGYGWKGTAYANKTNNAAESWLVSPAFDFRKATAPVLSFDEAFNFAEGKANEYTFVMISTDYTGGDVTKATWETLELSERAPGNSWNFISIKDVDLTKYVGNLVYVAFVYKSTSEAAPTWEFKNIKIAEKDAK